MPSYKTDLAQAIALRLALALVGLTSVLRSRMELASPTSGLDPIADAAFLHAAGSPSLPRADVPAALIAFARLTSAAALPEVLLGCLADTISAISLGSLATHAGADPTHAEAVASAFIWNPLAIAACISASAGPLKVAAVLLGAAAAASGRPVAAGAALAAAAHLSGPHVALFAAPMAVLAAASPEAERRRKSGPRVALVAALAATSSVFALAGAALVQRSWKGALRALPHSAISAAAGLLGLVPARHSAINGVENVARGGVLSWLHGGASISSSGSASPAMQPLWDDISPNLGLQWYLFAEVFPEFRQFFAYAFSALMVALMGAVAVRFRGRPLLTLGAQALAAGMLGRHPTYADIMLWLGLAPLLRWELRRSAPKAGLIFALVLGFGIALALNTAAFELWLTLGTGNANFLYGMNLLWAAWQAVALVQLLKAAREDETVKAD